ncbi:MAG: hypothetical protein ACIAQF_03620 [Phycisphaerales bacterium JB065]
MRSDSFGSRITRLVSTGLLLTLGALLGLPASASADEWFERAQKDMGLVTGNLSAEEVLFPAMIAMDELPFDISDQPNPFAYIISLPRGSSERQSLIEWVQSPNQQAVLEAVRTVADPDANYMFSLQIGTDKVKPEWAEAGFCIESGLDDLILDADYEYLVQMGNRLLVMMYVNGIAKAEGGEGDDALLDYAKFIALYRLLLERPSYEEKRHALNGIQICIQAMTDLVYQYTRPGDNAFTARGIADAVLETDDAVQRFRFRDFALPTLTEYAVHQAFDWATQGGRRVDPTRFAALMSLLHWSEPEGLERFGVYAVSQSMGSLQLDRVSFEQRVQDVFADYNRRWNYTDLHDPDLEVDSVGSNSWMDYEIITRLVEFQYPPLFESRLEMLTNLAGMRCALGVVAFKLENGTLPGQIVAIQPRYVRSLANNLDHLNYNERISAAEPLRYWVPIRDERFGPRETPTPYVIKAVFNSYGFPASGNGIQAASRVLDLADAIRFPGFGQTSDQLTDGDNPFDPSELGHMAGIDFEAFTGIRAEQTVRNFVRDGSLPRFGLPEEAHESLEAYFAGESDTFDYEALRELMKQGIAQEPPTERDANQMSVALSGLALLGMNPDNMAQKIREQMQEAIEQNKPDIPAGIDPSFFGESPLEQAFGMGDSEKISQILFGKSQSQLMDFFVDIINRIATMPSFRNAVTKANRGEFLNASQFSQLLRDAVDALVVPEVMTPLRDMLVHLRSSEVGDTLLQGDGAESSGDPVTFALDENSFLLYSVGYNGMDDRATLLDNGAAGDIAYWPPYMSLYREYLNR